MADPVGVKVEGLKGAIATLRGVDRALPRELGKANKELSTDIVVKADALAESLGGVAAHSAAAGLKASGRQAAVYVVLDAGKSPAVFGAEFGGGGHGPGNPTAAGGYTTQFQPFRGNGEDAGYFLYPTIRQEVADGEIERRYGRLVDQLMHTAFPN